MNVLQEFMDAVRQGPRMFFAPLVGALNAMKAEIDKSDRDQNAVALVAPQPKK